MIISCYKFTIKNDNSYLWFTLFSFHAGNSPRERKIFRFKISPVQIFSCCPYRLAPALDNKRPGVVFSCCIYQ